MRGSCAGRDWSKSIYRKFSDEYAGKKGTYLVEHNVGINDEVVAISCKLRML